MSARDSFNLMMTAGIDKGGFFGGAFDPPYEIVEVPQRRRDDVLEKAWGIKAGGEINGTFCNKERAEEVARELFNEEASK